MPLEPATLAALVVAISLAALINGAVGLGFALLSVNALAVVAGARDGVIVMSLMTPLVTVFQLWNHRTYLPLWRRLRPLLGGAVVGSVVGVPLFAVLPGAAISVALGVFTLWFVATTWSLDRAPVTQGTERRMAPFAGFIGGVTNSTLGASGPVFGTYLTAIGLRGREFIVAITLAFFTMSVVRFAGMLAFGQFTQAAGLVALVLIVPALVLQRAGFALQGRLPAAAMTRAVLVVLALAGLNLIWRGLSAILAG